MTYDNILLEVDKGVATLTLNRPAKLNALDAELLQEAAPVIRELNHDDDIKVLIITGAGRAFCSGADLTIPVSGADLNQSGIGRRARLEPFAGFGWLFRQIAEFAKPTIAAVNGIAAGAGVALALACDIRIASENARFSCLFVHRGLVADSGTTYHLPRLVGLAKALELMWTGDMVDAGEAERIGLVSRVVAAGDLMKAIEEFALRLARGPSVSIELTKWLAYESLKTNSLLSQIAHEDFAQYVCRQTEDAKEGINSFLEKREPRFQGR